MPKPSNPEDDRESLKAQVAAKGREIHQKYGPSIGWNELLQILEDRACVRYPCQLAFEASSLGPGEFAHPVARGARPEDGFTMYVHPHFLVNPDRVPYLVFYQLVLVNFGEFATADDAETFGAAALGLSKDDYYQAVCELADQLGDTSGS